jgi:transcription antitermination factor NusG
MVDEPSSLEAQEEADKQFRAGDRVRVVLGVLSGLSGVVIRPMLNHRYLLSIDGLDGGVHVVVKGIALERVIAC